MCDCERKENSERERVTFDPVEVKVNDIQSSKWFYFPALAPLGIQSVQRRRRDRLRTERLGSL
jgi:hypothetical protein